MLSVDECVSTVASKVLGPLESKTVPLQTALGHILARDAVAVEAIPAFPASIMDGFAMRSKDGPGKYPVDELSGATAGADGHGPLKEGHVRYITTGAPVPEGADTVVKVEDANQPLVCLHHQTPANTHSRTLLFGAQHKLCIRLVQPDGQLEIDVLCSSKPGANIRAVGGNPNFPKIPAIQVQLLSSLPGSDTQQGEVILQKGARIGAAEIGVAWPCPQVRPRLAKAYLCLAQVLAALGLANVEIFREPRVAIISTGDELVDVGAAGSTYGALNIIIMLIFCLLLCSRP